MTTPNKSNHWDRLAEDLGAKPTPEESSEEIAQPEPQDQATPEPTADQPEPAEKPAAERIGRPPRRQVDWDALANELGIVPQEPEPPAAEPGPVAADLVPLDDEQPGPEAAEPAEMVEQPEQAGAEPEWTLDLTVAPPPAEPPAEETPERPGRRGRRPRKARETPETVIDQADAFAETVLAAEVTDGGVTDSQEPAAMVAVPEKAEPDESRQKRRRKRRVGKRRKKGVDADEVEAEDASATSQELEVSDTEQVSAAADRSPEADGSKTKPAKRPKPSKASHRTIPTWQEAVGLIISTNLESRSKRPSGASRGRGPARSTGAARAAKEEKGSTGGRRPTGKSRSRKRPSKT